MYLPTQDIYHERAWLDSAVDMVQVKCVIELANAAHGAKVRRAHASMPPPTTTCTPTPLYAAGTRRRHGPG